MYESVKDHIFTGAILDENTISKNDYILGGDSELSIKLNNLIPNKNSTKEYNQSLSYDSRNFCTIYSAMGMLSDLKGVQFSNEKILEVGNLGVKAGWLDPNTGGYLYKAIDEVRNWWNKNNPTDKIISFQVDVTSQEFKEAIELGYSIQVGYKTSKEFNIDSQDDGVISGSDFPKIGGHAVRCRNGYINIIDNYFGKKKFNQYKISQVKNLVDNGIIFKTGYIFLNFNNMIFSDVSENSPFAEAIKWLKDNGISNGYSDGSFKPNQAITRGEMAQMLYNLSKK